MLIRESCRALQKTLQESGQALDHLEPWEAWKTFKQFLRSEVHDGYDAASLQFVPLEPDGDPDDEASLLLVRQYTERDATTGEDDLIGRVVLELRYAAKHFLEFQPVEVWTLDFPTLDEWASVVEGMPCFQEGMAREPLFTEVYYDDGTYSDK